MKKAGLLFCFSLFLLLLTACGETLSEEEQAAVGTYLGQTVTIFEETPMNEIYPSGENYIVLENSGRGVFVLEGDALEIEWTLEEGDLTLSSADMKSTGTLVGGLITVDFFGAGIAMTFRYEPDA